LGVDVERAARVPDLDVVEDPLQVEQRAERDINRRLQRLGRSAAVDATAVDGDISAPGSPL
jgi:hypothetical protein